MADVTLKQLPLKVEDLVDPGFEEALYSSSLPLLTSHLASQATDSKYTIPPPRHLALLITMLVHPSTTNTPFRRQASHLLSRVLDVANPRATKFDQAFTFARKRKRGRALDNSDEEEESCELENDSLFVNADNIWDVIEFAFMKGEGGWADLLTLIVRILRNDFEDCKERCTEDSILVLWLRDSGRKAAFGRALRAILATPGQEMMYDPPRGIYEDAKALPKRIPSTGDIWGGSVLLTHRIDLASMMYELAIRRQHFLSLDAYLKALEVRLCLIDHYSLASFLLNVPSLNFRMLLCEYMARQLAPELGKLVIEGLYNIEVFTENVFQRYIPSLPSTGREGASDLMKYCVISGLLFRGWVLYTKGKRKYPEMEQIIDTAIRRREQRVSELKDSAKDEIRKVVGREGRFLKAFSRKVIS